MNLTLLFFALSVLVVIALLIWALRPVPVKFRSAGEVFDALSTPRHYYRLPQILVALKEEDTEFLVERGLPDLARRLRVERRKIALKFVDLVEVDYKTLLEAARMLTAMAPEVLPGEEWRRLESSLLFSWNCMALRFRLRAGLNPWAGLDRLSEMASLMSYRLERATLRVSERALVASELPSFDEGGGKPR
jgi:hypothetical protein